MSKKTYSHDVAVVLAKKLSENKGVEHFIHDVGNGKYKVLTQAEIDALTTPAADQIANGTASEQPETTAEQVTTAAAQVTTATKSAQASAYANEVVQVSVPGKITKQYVITPEIGGRPRWFEIARLKSKPEMVDGQVVFTCTRGALLSRKLKELNDSASPVAA